MKKYSEIYLIGESPTAHGVYEKPQEYLVKVLCEVRSVGMNETWQMKNNHLKGEYVFVLEMEDLYTQVPNCKQVKYNGVKYAITRTSVDGTGKIRLVTSSEIKDR